MIGGCRDLSGSDGTGLFGEAACDPSLAEGSEPSASAFSDDVRYCKDISSSDSEPAVGDKGWLGGGRGTGRADKSY